MNRVLLSLLALVFCSTIMAEQSVHAFQIEFDKKVIYVDSLRMPPSINAETLLRLLPELLERPGESTLTSNYDIKVNGMSLGTIYDVALGQLQIQDIQKIEVTESPISTYEKNGQGGSIDIILRENSTYKKDKNDKFWGTASLGMLYPLDITPHLQLNYKNPKLSVQGVIFGELNKGTYESASTLENTVSAATQTIRERNQMIGAYIKYNPTQKDALSFKVAESFCYNRKNETTEYTTTLQTGDGEAKMNLYYSDALDTVSTTQLRFLTNYQHTFSRSTKLEVELQYFYNHGTQNSYDGAFYIDKVTRANTLSGTLNIKHRFFESDKRYGDMKIGSDYSFAFDNLNYRQEKYYERDWGTELAIDNIQGKGSSKYVMPYINWECRLKNFLMQAQGECQIFRASMESYGLREFTYKTTDFTGSVILEQQIGKPHHLRLIYRRKIQRPSAEQVYPFELLMISERVIQYGDKNLLPCHSDEVSLDYISRYTTGDHHFTIDINGTYNHLSDIITYNTQQLLGMTEDGHTGYSKRSFYNDTKADVWSANLMVFWKYRNFSLSFTGNLFNRHSVKNDALTNTIKEKNNTYFNLSLMPAFDLPSGWHSALYIAYHSPVKTTDYELGECALTQLNIGKSIGRFNIYFYQKSAFTGNVTDITYNNGGDTSRTHPLILSTVGIGVKYLF